MPNTETTYTRESDFSSKLFTNILCAVDGTWGSMAAVGLAASLAGPEGHLTLLAVTAAIGSGEHARAAISPSRAERIVAGARRVAEDAGVPCSTIVDPGGPPVDVIIEHAATHDLLAIGAPASSWLGAILLGGFSSSVGGTLVGGVTGPALSRFTTPMLVVRKTFAGTLRDRQILVASDGEEGSERLIELAGRLAQAQGAKARLVSAHMGESKSNPRVIEAQAKTLAERSPDGGKPYIEPGKAWEVILDRAQSSDAALIVMGSRRLSGLHAFGSVSRRVVHDAPCSVLVVPPRASQ
jgi:nucleotide-binding universal stress UspA family protein